MELAKHYCHTTAEIRWSAVEWGGTGLLFIAHKVKFVAWASRMNTKLEVIEFVYLRPPEGPIWWVGPIV